MLCVVMVTAYHVVSSTVMRGYMLLLHYFKSSFYCNSVCNGHLLNHSSTLKYICVMYIVGCSKITGIVRQAVREGERGEL